MDSNTNLHIHINNSIIQNSQTWTQPKCPSNTKCHIHTMEYFIVLKRKEIMIHSTTWMNLETMSMTINQTPKDKYYMTTLI